MKHNLLSSLLLTALLTTTAPVLAQVTTQPTASNAAQVERIAELKKRAIEGVEARAKLAQEMNDSIFSFGELAFQEFETSKYITDILEKNGFTVQRNVAGLPTGWVAKWGSGGPVIALGSDIDCIPKASQKPGVAYREADDRRRAGTRRGPQLRPGPQRGRGARAEGDHGARQDPRHHHALAGRGRGASRRQGLHGPRRRVQRGRRRALHPCRQQSPDRLGPAQRHGHGLRRVHVSAASPPTPPWRRGGDAARSTASSS